MTKELTLALLTGAAAAIIALPAAIAQPKNPPPGGPGQHRLFAHFDRNADGAISGDEFVAAREAHFARLDADKDGHVARSEFQSPRKRPANAPQVSDERRRKIEARRAARFGRLDTDGDGAVSRDEYAAGGNELFSRLDGDGDGRITRAEIASHRPPKRPR